MLVKKKNKMRAQEESVDSAFLVSITSNLLNYCFPFLLTGV